MTVTSMLDKVLKIATRQSPLALWQAQYVKARLEQAHPGLKVELVPMVTRGDIILDTPSKERATRLEGSFGTQKQHP